MDGSPAGVAEERVELMNAIGGSKDPTRLSPTQRCKRALTIVVVPLFIISIVCLAVALSLFLIRRSEAGCSSTPTAPTGSSSTPTAPTGSSSTPTTPTGSSSTPTAPTGSSSTPTTPTGSSSTPTTKTPLQTTQTEEIKNVSSTRSSNNSYNLTSPSVPLSTKRSSTARIFIIGGDGGLVGEKLLSSVEVFDVPTQTFSSGMIYMPSGRIFFGATGVRSFLHVVGGWGVNGAGDAPESDAQVLVAHERLGLAGGSTLGWEIVSPMPTARDCLAVVSSSTTLYAVGGWNETDELAIVEAFDVTNQTWSSLPPMPTPRSFVVAGIIGNDIVVAGGFYSNVTETYDLIGGKWTTSTPMHIARKGACAAVLDGELYVMGGRALNESNDKNTDGTNADVDGTDNDNGDNNNNGDTESGSGDSDNESNGNTDSSGDNGDNGDTDNDDNDNGDNDSDNGDNNNDNSDTDAGPILSSAEVFNVRTNSWRRITDMSVRRQFCGAASLDGFIYVFGGMNEEALDSVEVYDPASNTWRVLPVKMRIARSKFGIATISES